MYKSIIKWSVVALAFVGSNYATFEYAKTTIPPVYKTEIVKVQSTPVDEVKKTQPVAQPKPQPQQQEQQQPKQQPQQQQTQSNSNDTNGIKVDYNSYDTPEEAKRALDSHNVTYSAADSPDSEGVAIDSFTGKQIK